MHAVGFLAAPAITQICASQTLIAGGYSLAIALRQPFITLQSIIAMPMEGSSSAQNLHQYLDGPREFRLSKAPEI
jgi:hypothetical protein